MVTSRKLDMRKADGYAVTEADLILGAVREDGLGGIDLLFSGLEGKHRRLLLRNGTLYPESNYIFATPFPDRDELGDSQTSPLYCAQRREIPLMAVYDGTKLMHLCADEYEFVDPNKKSESLLAVYLLKY